MIAQDILKVRVYDAKEIPYPLVMTNIAIENGPVEIVDLPIQKWWIFPVCYLRYLIYLDPPST
jgi:hypothetical protein